MGPFRLAIEFLEGFLTVFVSTVSGVMMTQGQIVMPPAAALLLGGLGGAVAGIRKVQARLAEPRS